MTASQPATPGSDGEVCEVCGYDQAAHEAEGEMLHGFRPAAPSPVDTEPPAGPLTPEQRAAGYIFCPAHQDPSQPHHPQCPWGLPVETPTEAQQDRELRAERAASVASLEQKAATFAAWLDETAEPERTIADAFIDGWDAALAARPSADTETLPDRAEVHYAGMQAVREMPSDWYCPRSEPGRSRRDCPECVAEVALDAALAVVYATHDAALDGES